MNVNMVDQEEIEKLERIFTAYLLTGSEVVENRSNDMQRAGIAYQIEDHTCRLIKKKSEFMGEHKKYTPEYVEYEALLSGIEDVKQSLPAKAIDLQIRTANTTVVDQLSKSDNPMGPRGLADLAKCELATFRDWEVKEEAEDNSERIRSINHSAEGSFRGGGTKFVPGSGEGYVKVR